MVHHVAQPCDSVQRECGARSGLVGGADGTFWDGRQTKMVTLSQRRSAKQREYHHQVDLFLAKCSGHRFPRIHMAPAMRCTIVAMLSSSPECYQACTFYPSLIQTNHLHTLSPDVFSTECCPAGIGSVGHLRCCVI